MLPLTLSSLLPFLLYMHESGGGRRLTLTKTTLEHSTVGSIPSAPVNSHQASKPS